MNCSVYPPATEIAKAENRIFPISMRTFAARIETYQQLGCWTPHADITRAADERTLDVFEYNRLLKQRYRYE